MSDFYLKNINSNSTENFFNLTKAKSYHYQDDFDERLEQEGIIYPEIVKFLDNDYVVKHDRLRECSSDTEQIPSITSLVYVFAENSSKLISQNNIDASTRSVEKLNSVHDHWQHFFWTNDANKVDLKIKESKNLVIKDINEFSGHKLYDSATYLIKRASEKDNPAPVADLTEASDIVRLMALHKYGGVYFDTNYEIFKPEMFYEITKKYSVALAQESREERFPNGTISEKSQWDVANNIIMVKHGHEVTDCAVDLVYRNLYELSPKYVTRGFDKSNKLVYETGPPVLSVCFFKYVENGMAKNDTEDFLFYPEGGLSNYKLARCIQQNENCNMENEMTNKDGHIIETISADPLGAPWTNYANYDKPLQYFNVTLHNGTDLECGPWETLPKDLSSTDYILGVDDNENYLCGIAI